MHNAGVLVDYVSEQPLLLRQWTGYDPPPDARYLASIGRADGIPPQWHVEAASREPIGRTRTVTVMRPYRKGNAPQQKVVSKIGADATSLSIPGTELLVELSSRGATFATVRKGNRQWTIARPVQ